MSQGNTEQQAFDTLFDWLDKAIADSLFQEKEKPSEEE